MVGPKWLWTLRMCFVPFAQDEHEQIRHVGHVLHPMLTRTPLHMNMEPQKLSRLRLDPCFRAPYQFAPTPQRHKDCKAQAPARQGEASPKPSMVSLPCFDKTKLEATRPTQPGHLAQAMGMCQDLCNGHAVISRGLPLLPA